MSRVLIVEDHAVVAAGLELGLKAEGFEVQSTDGSPADLRRAFDAFRPEVVLLDLHLGRQGSGIALIPGMREAGATVVVLTADTDPIVLASALEAGARVVLNKAIPFSRLVREVSALPDEPTPEAEETRQAVLRRARAAAADRQRRLAPFADLTPREEEVLGMLIAGRRAADIASASFVSLATVRSQIRSILTKVGVGSQLAAVSLAMRAGWAPRMAPGHAARPGSSV